MATLGNPKNTLEIIRKYEFKFRKRFGQNFLVDENILRRIVGSAELGQDDCVLEIGPGIGTLTQYLAEAAGHVVAVEIDRDLVPILKEDTLAGYDNVTIINEDILKTDLKALSQEYNGGKPFSVVANLPYYITTPIIMRLFEEDAPVKSVTVMVQKEVADRMQAEPGGKEYGALSLSVRYYAEAEIVTLVPPGAFIPRPKVGSAVIRLIKRKEPAVSVSDPEKLFRIIRASFMQRRKTLQNALSNDAGLSIEKKYTAEALRGMGLPETVRGEAMSLEEFAAFTERLNLENLHT